MSDSDDLTGEAAELYRKIVKYYAQDVIPEGNAWGECVESLKRMEAVFGGQLPTRLAAAKKEGQEEKRAHEARLKQGAEVADWLSESDRHGGS